MIKNCQCLPSLDQDVLTLANIDLSNNVSDNDTNIDESKEEELPLNLNTVSDGKVNEENDINTSMEKACKVARSSLLFARCSLLFARCLLLFACCSTRNSGQAVTIVYKLESAQD